MRRKLKLVFRTLLSFIGIYQGLQMILGLWILANQLPETVSALQGTPLISSSVDPNLYFFSLTQTLLLLTFNVLCIVASQKRLQWSWLLSCGIVGIAGHLVTIMYGIYLRTFTVQYMLFVLPFFARPSLILVVALYERTHPDNDFCQPISTTMRIRQPAGRRNV